MTSSSSSRSGHPGRGRKRDIYDRWCPAMSDGSTSDPDEPPSQRAARLVEKLSADRENVDALPHAACNWADFPLVADELCNLATSQLHCSAIVLGDEHARMWNLPTHALELNAAAASGAPASKPTNELVHPFWVDANAVAHVIPDDLLTRVGIARFGALRSDEGAWCGPNELLQTRLDLRRDFDAVTRQPATTSRQSAYAREGAGHTSDAVATALGADGVDDDSGTASSDRPTARERWLRVVLAANLPRVLASVEPHLLPRLLLVDQYETFVDPRFFANTKFVYVFTGGPIPGRLSVADEVRFYDRLRSYTADDGSNASRRDSKDDDDDGDSDDVSTWGRRAALAWLSFVPSNEYLLDYTDDWMDRDPRAETPPSVHWLDLNLWDSNDTLFWRNVVSAMLENEFYDVNESPAGGNSGSSSSKSSKSSPTGQQRRHTLLIRLRLTDVDVRAYVSELLPAWSQHDHRKHDNASTTRHRVGVRLRTRNLLRLKRFLAFFERVSHLASETLTRGPLLQWTVMPDERWFLHDAYANMSREACLGESFGLTCFDRYTRRPEMRATASGTAAARGPSATAATSLYCPQSLLDHTYNMLSYGDGADPRTNGVRGQAARDDSNTTALRRRRSGTANDAMRTGGGDMDHAMAAQPIGKREVSVFGEKMFDDNVLSWRYSGLLDATEQGHPGSRVFRLTDDSLIVRSRLGAPVYKLRTSEV